MLFGLIVVACLIANLHAAVFYVFFVLLLPYFAEYAMVLLSDSNIVYKLKMRNLKKKIEKLVKMQAPADEIEKVQTKLCETEERFKKFKENSDRRRENPYRIKLIKRDAVKWLVLVAVLCFATRTFNSNW